MKKQIVLSVSHHLYLTKEERYKLHEECPNGEELTIIGMSVPVWFERGNTSEPAEEVFTKYILKNDPKKSYSIINQDYGYKINLPQVPEDFKIADLSDEEWRAMTEKERTDWYADNKMPNSSKNLLDYKDGGGKTLKWTMVSNLIREEKKLTIYNHVSIDDMAQLTESLVFA